MRPLILIPSFNSGRILKKTVQDCLEVSDDWPVLVVIDGSTDGSASELEEFASHPRLLVISYEKNRGKGHALMVGAEVAEEEGYTHLLTIDSDSQHPVDFIPRYIDLATQYPDAVICGRPIFDENAPMIRQQGRKIANALVHLETFGWGVDDVLFGMRCYPLDVFLRGMRETRWGRRYDFDTEIVARFAWAEVPAINFPTPVRYLSSEEGGISHFHYVRDNTLFVGTHLRLLGGFLIRLPGFLIRPKKNPLIDIPID